MDNLVSCREPSQDVPVGKITRGLNREHLEIMEAVIARDAERAAALMARHLELTTRVLLEQSWPGVARPAATRRARSDAETVVAAV